MFLLYALLAASLVAPLAYILITRQKREANNRAKFAPLGVNLVQFNGTKWEFIEHISMDFGPVLLEAQRTPSHFPLISSIEGYGTTVISGKQYGTFLSELKRLDPTSTNNVRIIFGAVQDRIVRERLGVEFAAVLEQ